MDIIQLLVSSALNEKTYLEKITELINNYQIPLGLRDVKIVFSRFREYCEDNEDKINLMVFLLSDTLRIHKNLFIAILMAVRDGYKIKDLECLVLKIGNILTVSYSPFLVTPSRSVYCDLYDYYKFDINKLQLIGSHKHLIYQHINKINAKSNKPSRFVDNNNAISCL
jgi:hypothetical protein